MEIPPPRLEEPTLVLRAVVRVLVLDEDEPEDAPDVDAVLLTTGLTSTVLAAAALLRPVRRRGVGEGVAIRGKVWKRNGNDGGDGLPIRPDSSDR